MTLEERIDVLENRVALLERLQIPSSPLPFTQPSAPQYDNPGEWKPPMPLTWCCARNGGEE